MAIAQKGGVEAVVAAMGAHKGNADVQHFGCWALTNLGFNGRIDRPVGRACLCQGVRVHCVLSVCRVHVWRGADRSSVSSVGLSPDHQSKKLSSESVLRGNVIRFMELYTNRLL